MMGLLNKGQPMPPPGGQPVPPPGGQPMPPQGGQPMPPQGGQPMPSPGGAGRPEGGVDAPVKPRPSDLKMMEDGPAAAERYALTVHNLVFSDRARPVVMQQMKTAKTLPEGIAKAMMFGVRKADEELEDRKKVGIPGASKMQGIQMAANKVAEVAAATRGEPLSQNAVMVAMMMFSGDYLPYEGKRGGVDPAMVPDPNQRAMLERSGVPLLKPPVEPGRGLLGMNQQKDPAPDWDMPAEATR